MDYLSLANSTKSKIFVGGIKSWHTEENIRDYFEKYGLITRVQLKRDPETKNWRGFGFITYATFDAAQQVASKRFHDVGGVMVEAKRAGNREQMRLIDRYTAWRSRGYRAWPKPRFSRNFVVNTRREALVNEIVHSMFLARLRQLDKRTVECGNTNGVRMNPARD